MASRRSDDEIESSDEFLGSLDVDELFFAGVSERLEIPFTVPLLFGPGDYFMLIRTDSEDAIAECNKENNVIATGFTLITRTAAP